MAFVVRAGVRDRVRRQADAREVGRAEKRSSHLLEDDREFYEREALSAVFLGDVDPGESEFVRELLPNVGVEAFRRFHEPPDLG